MISCFTVTQEGRLEVLARAVADFCAQTVREKELVILHDAGPAFHDSVSRLAAEREQAVASLEVARDPARLLERTLDAWGERGDVWIFGYASLIWRPEFAAAEELRFEYAAKLRDELKSLRHELLAIGA